MEKLTITQQVSFEDIADLLCSAFEGGSNYWYEIQDKITPSMWKFDERPVYATPEEAEANIHVHYLQYYPLNPHGALLINDARADEPTLEHPVRLDLGKVKEGLQILADKYPHHFGDIIRGNADGVTADAFLQCCILGDIIYG